MTHGSMSTGMSAHRRVSESGELLSLIHVAKNRKFEGLYTVRETQTQTMGRRERDPGNIYIIH